MICEFPSDQVEAAPVAAGVRNCSRLPHFHFFLFGLKPEVWNWSSDVLLTAFSHLAAAASRVTEQHHESPSPSDATLCVSSAHITLSV